MSQSGPDVFDEDGLVISVRHHRSSPRLRVQVAESLLPSRTKQSDAQGADINFIVGRYKKTGELPVPVRAPMFSDMSSTDYKEAMDLFTSAQQSFALLPAATRNAFANDPSQLLAALDRSDDPQVRLYLEEAGLFEKGSALAEVTRSTASKASDKESKPKTPKAPPEAPKASGNKAD